MNPLQSLYYVSPACLVCLAVPFRERWPGRQAAAGAAAGVVCCRRRRGTRLPREAAACRPTTCQRLDARLALACLPPACVRRPHITHTHTHTRRLPLAPAVAIELKTFITEPPAMYPSVLIANALAAFALNLVRWCRQCTGSSPPGRVVAPC